MLTNGNLGVVLTCILANFSCFDPLGSYNFGEFRGNTKYCVCFDILNFLDGGGKEGGKQVFVHNCFFNTCLSLSVLCYSQSIHFLYVFLRKALFQRIIPSLHICAFFSLGTGI